MMDDSLVSLVGSIYDKDTRAKLSRRIEILRWHVGDRIASIVSSPHDHNSHSIRRLASTLRYKSTTSFRIPYMHGWPSLASGPYCGRTANCLFDFNMREHAFACFTHNGISAYVPLYKVDEFMHFYDATKDVIAAADQAWRSVPQLPRLLKRYFEFTMMGFFLEDEGKKTAFAIGRMLDAERITAEIFAHSADVWPSIATVMVMRHIA